MATKDFKTIDEQLEILRSRGLSITDDEKAKEFLLYNNYYRISGYSLTLRKNDTFFKNADGQIDNSHLYGFVLVMKRLLSFDNFSEMKNSIISLTKKYPFVRMDYYGFRNDWQDKL